MRTPTRWIAVAALAALACRSTPTGSDRVRAPAPSATTTAAATSGPGTASPAPAEPAAEAARAAVAPRPWQHERSDLAPHERIRFGALANGLRYAWMPNPEPRERCSLRLHVDVGSLAERDDELGMAHFLEHMAFNGSEGFPGTSVVEWLQSHGMGFGADSNAHTSFGETVYELDLPSSDAAAIAEGLHVLRQFAGELTLDPREVEGEKGVIDAEERERESAGWRAERERLERLLAGTRAAVRMPIGKPEVRARFDAAALRAFYGTWYRPDLMTLVVVGDLGTLDPMPLIANAFADLENPPGPRPAEPAPGAPTFADLAFAVRAEELATQLISVRRLVRWTEDPATRASWTRDVPLETARAMLDLRFAEIAKREDAPFLVAGAADAELLRALDGEELSIGARPERWREALTACVLELRRALEHGFAEAELAEVRANALRALDEQVEREPTRLSASWAGEIAAAAEDPLVPASAATARAVLRPAIEALTPERCAAALREAWGRGELSLSTVGALDLGEDAARALREAWDAAQALPVEAIADAEAAAFAYPADERRAPIASRTRDEALGVEDVRFANGLRALLKPTDFAKREVRFELRIGAGELALGRADHAAGWVLAQCFVGSGLGAHSADDLRRLFAGRRAGVAFDLGPDAFTLRGATTADDLLGQCELARAFLVDPGWRPEGLAQFQKALVQMHEGLAHRHAGPLYAEFLPALYGDPRFSLPPRAAAEAVTADDLARVFAEQVRDASATLVLVGDFEVEAALDAIARTLGHLSERREPSIPEENARVDGPRAGLAMDRTIDTEVEKTMTLVVFPTTDGFEARVRRALQLVGDVLGDRLRVALRERLGASYAPNVQADTSAVYRGVGGIAVQAMAEPAQAKALVEATLAEAGRLGADGVAEDELERLRAPLLARLRDAKRANGFWTARLADAHRRPVALAEIGTMLEDFGTIGADEISRLAASYLVPARASVLTVAPEAP